MYDYGAFKRDVYRLTNINLDYYKEKQMKRRIDALIARHGYDGYETFVHGLRTDPALMDAFVNHLTINVSEFYRNPGQWQVFEKDILPLLLKNAHHNKLTIWSAACSTGDEPYTIAMILAKYMPLSQVKIYATDIDEAVLRKAQLGVYPEKSLAGLPKAFYQQYFTKTPDGRNCQISNELRKCIEFRKHNLLEDPYFTNVDMIVCRNVVIYFTDDAKDMIYKQFYQSLVPDGMLFIGSTEQIMHADTLGFSVYRSFFYQKQAALGSGKKPF